MFLPVRLPVFVHFVVVSFRARDARVAFLSEFFDRIHDCFHIERLDGRVAPHRKSHAVISRFVQIYIPRNHFNIRAVDEKLVLRTSGRKQPSDGFEVAGF